MDYIFTLFGPYSFSIIEAHMAFVHLPIGFLLGSAIFDTAACLTHREDHHAHWRHTAFWLLLLGTLCAVIAAALGYFGNPFATKHNIMAQRATVHMYFGFGVVGVFLLLSCWRIIRNGRHSNGERFAYALLLLFAVALITATGFLGSRIAM